SRRRHTRSKRDWSSDVCSSDLLVKWLKKPGDKIARDEPLFEISTDKVDAEIPSPAAGVLKEIMVKEGETVAIKTVVATIEAEGAATGAKETAAPRAGTQRPSAQQPSAPQAAAQQPSSQQAPSRQTQPGQAGPMPAAARPSGPAREERPVPQ